MYIPSLLFLYLLHFSAYKYYPAMSKQDGQHISKRSIEARSRNHSCRGKAVSIIRSRCVFVALIIQNAKRMRRIIFSSVACMALLPFFPPTLKKSRFSGGGGTEPKNMF